MPLAIVSTYVMFVKRFMRKHADAELLTVMDSTVPPLSLDSIGLFRACLSKYRKQALTCGHPATCGPADNSRQVEDARVAEDEK